MPLIKTRDSMKISFYQDMVSFNFVLNDLIRVFILFGLHNHYYVNRISFSSNHLPYTDPME